MENNVRKWLIFIVLWLWGSYSFAQNKSVKGVGESPFFIYTFEPDEYFEQPGEWRHVNAYQYIEFDDSGIWQIGHPAKGDWDSTCQGEYALMTDTAKMIDRPVKASFTFKFKRPWYSKSFNTWYITTKHLYDLPIGKAGFYIEASYDEGKKWWQLPEDTLPCIANGEYAPICHPVYYEQYLCEYPLNEKRTASGQRNEWGDGSMLASKSIDEHDAAANYFGVWLRFTYENLDTFSHKGWIIDELMIMVSHDFEDAIIEASKQAINIYPNPLIDKAVFDFNNELRKSFLMDIYDVKGVIVYSCQTFESSVSLARSEFKRGLYLCRVRSVDGLNHYTGKFLVE